MDLCMSLILHKNNLYCQFFSGLIIVFRCEVVSCYHGRPRCHGGAPPTRHGAPPRANGRKCSSCEKTFFQSYGTPLPSFFRAVSVTPSASNSLHAKSSQQRGLRPRERRAPASRRARGGRLRLRARDGHRDGHRGCQRCSWRAGPSDERQLGAGEGPRGGAGEQQAGKGGSSRRRG
jgi:hypothetical protein